MTQLLEISSDWRVECLKYFGNFTLAYATLSDPLLNYFGDNRGYIAFRRFWSYTYVLGDPVTSAERLPYLIREFLDRFPRSVFCQVSESTAEQLQSLGYWINEMGVDTYLDLRTYNFFGKSKAGLRYSANWLNSHGYSIEEVSIDSRLRSEMLKLIEQWRSRRVNRKEVVFLNRQAVLEDEEDVRKFVLRSPNGSLEAFIFFDPLYRDGNVVGYVTAIKRRSTSAPSYAELGLCKQCIELFQSEGKETLRLGLSPLANITNDKFRHIRPLHYSWRYLHKAFWVNRYFYNFLGHAQFKRRFGGIEEKTYYATQVYFNDLRIIGWLRMMQLI